MAKKGASEINGFVSVQNDERKITKKVVKRDSSVTAHKNNPSNNKPHISETQKIKKSGEEVKLKKSTVDLKRRINEHVTSKTQSSNIKKATPEDNKNVSKQTKSQDLLKPKRNESQDVSRTTKPTNAAASRVKTSSVSTSKVSSSEPPNSEKKGTADSKIKGTQLERRKETKTKSITEMQPSRKIPPSRVSSSLQAQNRQAVKNSSNVTVPKLSKSIPKQDQDTSKTFPKNKSSKSQGGNSKQVVNDKKTSVSRNSDKTYAKEKVSSNFKDTDSNKEKKINSLTNNDISIPEENNNATSYKDFIYFEVDMGKGKEMAVKNEKITEVVEPILQFDLNINENSDEKELSSKKEILKPPLSAVSRQGTFTKEDSENNNDSLNLPVIDNIETESKVSNSSSNEEYDYEDDFETRNIRRCVRKLLSLPEEHSKYHDLHFEKSKRTMIILECQDYESDFEEYVSESGVSSKSESLSDDINPIPTKTEPVKAPVQKETRTRAEKTVEEEKKLDSGSYDLTTKLILPQSVKEKQLAQIKEAISRENSLYSERREVGVPVEGNKEVVILDFLGALKNQEKEEVGTEAEILMRDEDLQTDDIKVQNKWTQFPVSYHSLKKTDNPLQTYIEDSRGYGGDSISTDINSWMNRYYNSEKLYSFVESAGQVILIMLEEQERWIADGRVSVHKAKHDHGFSRGYIPIQTKNLQFLKSRPIVDVLFSPHNPNIFLSSHRFVKDIENVSSFEDQFLGRSIICLWNILEPSQPLSMFVASCQASAVTFDIVHSNLFYAGLTDGSVCLWDTSERSVHHKETVAGSMDFLLRTPTYCSSYLLGDEYHNNVIVSIQSLGYEIKDLHAIEKFSPTQVVTLDSDGKVIIWVTVGTVSQIESGYSMEKQDFGQVFWGTFKLVASRTLTPANHLPLGRNTWSLQFLCMNLTPLTNRSILLGTNSGFIVHCSLSEENLSVPIFCSREDSHCTTSVLSIEKSPHQLPIFLAGCSNGTIRIHTMDRKRPLRILMMDSQMKGIPVSKLRWSFLGAGMFFALDKTISLHIWDLCKSEVAPLLTLSMKKLKATHFDVSSDKKYVYIALVVNKDRLEIHRLKEQFTPEECVTNNKGIERFMSFIDKCCY